jgi:hypothetical protein
MGPVSQRRRRRASSKSGRSVQSVLGQTRHRHGLFAAQPLASLAGAIVTVHAGQELYFEGSQNRERDV